MAPPIVVVDQSLVKVPQNCPLKAIVQFECGILDSQVTCTEFKRLFRVCEEKGRKHPRSYEVTDFSASRRNLRGKDIKQMTKEVLSLESK